MPNAHIENKERNILESNISSRLRSIPSSKYGLCSGTFFLLKEDLAEWVNPPVNFSYIFDVQRVASKIPEDYLYVDLQEAVETKKHLSWKGLSIRLLPNEFPQYYPYLAVILHPEELPQFLYSPGKPAVGRMITEARIKIGGLSLFKKNRFVLENRFEDVRDFEDSDYGSLNRIINKLRGPLAKYK